VIRTDAAAELKDTADRVELKRGGQPAAFDSAGIGCLLDRVDGRICLASKQRPRIRVALCGQEAACSSTVLEFWAVVALAAWGTVPRAPKLMFWPLIVASAIFPPVTEPSASLPLVTDLACSWRVPTELRGTLSAKALPPKRN
jgi:hypothetical protein